MTDNGAGGLGVVLCHVCQKPVRFAATTIEHLDGSPLCIEAVPLTDNHHLPECWVKHESDPPAWCLCDELRACEQRVLAAAVQRVEAIADDRESGVDWNWDYEADPTGMTRNPLVWIREAVAAIKNEVK